MFFDFFGTRVGHCAKKEKSTLGSTFLSKVLFCHFSKVTTKCHEMLFVFLMTYFFKSSQQAALPTKFQHISSRFG